MSDAAVRWMLRKFPVAPLTPRRVIGEAADNAVVLYVLAMMLGLAQACGWRAWMCCLAPRWSPPRIGCELRGCHSTTDGAAA